MVFPQVRGRIRGGAVHYPEAPPEPGADDASKQTVPPILSRKPTSAWLTPYSATLGAVIVLYVASTGWLLASTGFLPYVMDNNESFSSLVHASNLDRFGLSNAFGLTDES